MCVYLVCVIVCREWTLFNDARVERVSAADVAAIGRLGYILFYVRDNDRS